MTAGDPPPSRSRALVEHHDQLPVPAAAPPSAPPPPGGGHGQGGGHGTAPDAKSPRVRTLLLILLPVLLVLVGIGTWTHIRRASRADQARRDLMNYVPTVRTAQARRDTDPLNVTLPGQSVAFDEASVFARATGYVAERRADIGTRVRRGDLLLRIAAPDLDQQLVQAAAQLGQLQAQLVHARATVEQAQANTKFANVTKFRTTTLASQGWETRQNADQSIANATVQASNVDAAEAGVKVAEANFRAQMAAVQRLRALTAFENVVAPFDGVVTIRNVDTGDLVSADANGGSPLFTLQRDNVLRISVQVPQSDAIGLHDGQDAEITVPELPGRTMHGTVSRSSVALATGSRSLMAEVDVPNGDHSLRPGLYMNVTFHIPRQSPVVTVPADAVMFGAGGLQAAVLDHQNHVHFHQISIGRDLGQSVELTEGLQGGETIVLGLPAGVDDGGSVKPQTGGPDKPKT
jgi:HlyD family secretion protein